MATIPTTQHLDRVAAYLRKKRDEDVSLADVVETLQHIDDRISRFAEAVRTKDLTNYISEADRVREERKRDLLLHGPQLEGEGIEQEDIDMLLAGGVRAGEQT